MRKEETEAKRTVDSDMEWNNDMDNQEENDEETYQAVMTRQQARVEKMEEPVNVADSIAIEISGDKLIKLQTEDESLTSTWKRSEEQDNNQLSAAIVEPEKTERVLELYATIQTESYKDVVIGEDLTVEQREQVQELVIEFKDIFTDVPKVTNLGEHSIQLSTDEPIRGKAYQLPHAMRKTEDKELEVCSS
jgi:hypothetical protein